MSNLSNKTTSLDPRQTEIINSSIRLKRLVLEMENSIQPLASVSKFDEVQSNDLYQQFLFNPQNGRKNNGQQQQQQQMHGSRTRRNTNASETGSYVPDGKDDSGFKPSITTVTRHLSVGSDADGGKSADEDEMNRLFIQNSLENAFSHPSDENFFHGNGNDTDSQGGDTIPSSKVIKSEHPSFKLSMPSVLDVNDADNDKDNYSDKSYKPAIPGSLEFCVVEAKLHALNTTTPQVFEDDHRHCGHDDFFYSSCQHMHSYEIKLSKNGNVPIFSSYFPSFITSCYPFDDEEPSVGNITDFCFPSGVAVTVCSSSSAHCYTDPSFDKFHIMQFTNSFGTISYACCLTVKLAKPLPSDVVLTKKVLELSLQQKAARCIIKALRHFAAIGKRLRWAQPHFKQFRPPTNPPESPMHRGSLSNNSKNDGNTTSSSTTTTATSASPLKETRSFFSKYFGTGQSHSKATQMSNQLTKLFQEAEVIVATEKQDTYLPKLLELSTALKKAKKANYTYANMPIIEKCDLLLQRYGAVVETNTNGTSTASSSSTTTGGGDRSSFQLLSSNRSNSQSQLVLPASSQQQQQQQQMPVYDVKSKTEARLSDIAKKANRRRLSSSGGSNSSSEEDDNNNSNNDIRSYTTQDDLLNTGRSSIQEQQQHHQHHHRKSASSVKRSWNELLNPIGKVMVVQQAYCAITTSPHHALVFNLLINMANADRRFIRNSLGSPLSKSINNHNNHFSNNNNNNNINNNNLNSDNIVTDRDSFDKEAIASEKLLLHRRMYLQHIHRTFETSPEIYLDLIPEETEVTTKQSLYPLASGVAATTRRLNLTGRKAANIEMAPPPPSSSSTSSLQPGQQQQQQQSYSSSMMSPRTPANKSKQTSTAGSETTSPFVPRFRSRDIAIPGYIDAIPLDPLRFPTTREWTSAILFSCLSASQIFKIINLLLMEKSLVIVGKDAGIVTALAFAVTNLLSPFSWQGVFVPLLPNNAKEFFDAPVPYILGSTVAPGSGEVSPQTAVLVVQELTHTTTTLHPPANSNSNSALASTKSFATTSTTNATAKAALRRSGNNNSNGVGSNPPVAATDVNMSLLRNEAVSNGTIGFSGWFTRLPEVNADLPMEKSLTEVVTRACKFFQFEQIYRRRTTHSVRMEMPVLGEEDHYVSATTTTTTTTKSFKEQQINMLLMTYMTKTETRLVNSVINMIAEHNFKFTGDLCDYSAWHRYVRTNPNTEMEEFVPELFMEPIKRILEFHEAVVQTQLFVGLVDRIRIQHKSLDPFRIFISDWIYFRMHMKAQQRQDPVSG